MPTINISFTASNQLQASRGLFSFESPGSQFAKQGGSSGSLTIVTASLPNALVGQFYSTTLSATGGTGSYSWNLVSCTPNTDLWLSCLNSAISGIPQLTETESVTIQVTDSIGNTAQANLNLVVGVTGALSIVTPPSIPGYYTAASAIQNGIVALRMLAQGGQPPYWWAFAGPVFTVTGAATATQYAMSNFGWLSGACTASSGIDTLNVIVTDNNGATATQTVSMHASPTLQPYPRDSVSNAVNLPNAYASTAYQTQLHASGGSGTGYTYSVVSGLPAGLSVSTTGLITGSPGLSGSAQITLQVKDSASNITSFGAAINILSKNQVARPSYNTGAGFFVDASGLFRDPNGSLFRPFGVNRTHYDSDSWAGPAAGALASPNVVRVFMFDGQTAAFAANQVTTQYAPNDILTVLTLAGISGTGTTGSTDPAVLTNAVNDWVSYQSTLSTVMNQIVINVANEWGPANSTTWRDSYITAVSTLRGAGYTCPILIDTGSSGEDLFDITNYAVAINASDPQGNCIFSLHPYQTAWPFQGIIQSVTLGSPTVLTLASNSTTFPLNPGASTAGNDNFIDTYLITGAQGLTLLNGIQAADVHTFGSQNNWQVHLTVNSSSWTGTYVAGSAALYSASTSTSNRTNDYRYICSLFQALQASGVCAIIGEFGPGNQSGNITTPESALNSQQVAPGQMMSACDAYGLGCIPWAWDDHSGTNTLFVPNYFNMVLAVGPGYGGFSANNKLTAYGLDVVTNPRYGLWARSTPAPSFLTTTPPVLPAIKWHPGHYMLSDNFPTTSDTGGSGGINHNEIQKLATTGTSGTTYAGSNVLGYAAQYLWQTLEPTTLGTYTFAAMVADFNYLQAQCPGARFIPILFCAKEAKMTGSQAPQGLPTYLTTNVGTYGAGANGTNSGYWVSGWDASHSWYNICVAALWRPAVQARYLALFQALADFSFTTTAGPYSGQIFTFNTHPLIEGVMDGSELSYNFNSGGTVGAPGDYTSTAFYTQYNALMQAIPQTWTQTSFAPFQSFGTFPTAAGHTSYSDLFTQIANDSPGRLALSNSDVLADPAIVTSAATSTLSWGQKIYIGLKSSSNDGASGNWVSGGTDYRGTMAFMANVQAPDYDYGGNTTTTAVTTIYNACNTTLKATHILWCTQSNANPGGIGIGYFTTYVLPVINANPTTITAYPGNYPSALVPNISALAPGASASAPWTTFLAATGGYSGWATNTLYNDPLGSVLRRMTNRSTLAGGGEFVMEYAEGGPKISQALSSGQYWIACLYGTSGSHSNYFVKYQLGVGYVAGSAFASPIAQTGLNVSFSMLSGEASICYIADSNTSLVHRYDCNAKAYAPNSIFNGTNASIDCGVNGPGWCATSWDGSTLTFQAPYAGPTALFSLNLLTGTLSSYTGSATSTIMPTGIVVTSSTGSTITVTGAGWATTPGNGQFDGATVVMTSGAANGKSATVNSNTSSVLTLAGSISPTPSGGDTFRIYNVNELHVMHGNPFVVWLEDNNSSSSLPYAWFPATGKCTDSVSRSVGYGGHSDAGANNLYTMNPNVGAYKVLNQYTPGTAPATDGGPWSGVQTNYWGTTAATEPDDTGGHFNISWAQQGAGTNEWATRDSFGEPYNDISGTWSLFSGAIYKTNTTSGNVRPISGILLWNGTVGIGSKITGSLAQVASTGAMTAGTFYTDGTAVYAWLPSSAVVTNSNTIMRAGGLQTDRIAYYKQDGTQIRTLCWLYYEPQDAHNVYYHNGGYANISPDGYICVFASDLGTYSGFADLIVAEVPLT